VTVDNLPVAAMQSMGTSSVFAIDVGSVCISHFKIANSDQCLQIDDNSPRCVVY
jgi:hypothetical protein